MIVVNSTIKFILVIVIIMSCHSVQGQICVNRYLSLVYKGTDYGTFSRTIYTKNQLLAVGTLTDGSGHIALFSANGTPLWSYKYRLDYYDFIKAIFFKTVRFTDALATSDGGYLISGNVDQVLSPYGLPPPVKKYALLIKIDPFGKVLWNKTLSNMGELSFSTLTETAAGDYVAYLATDNGSKKMPGDHSYGKVIRVSPDGSIKWSTQLFTFLFDAGGLGLTARQAITQCRNTDIVVAQVVHKTIWAGSHYRIYQGNLHLLQLDYSTGKVKRETSYEYPVPPSDSLFTPDIVQMNELPDGRLSLFTSLYLSAAGQPAFIKKGVQVITGNTGTFEKIIAYSPLDGSASEIKEVADDPVNGGKTIWIKTAAGEDILTNIAVNGQINWSKGYNNDGGRFPASSFTAGSKGNYIFGGNNVSFFNRLLVTDTEGAIDCVNLPAGIVAGTVPFDFPHDSVITSTTMNFDNYQDFAYPLKRKEDYPLNKNIDCLKTLACCTDYIDSTSFTHINLCETKTYLLPDSTVVKEAGDYYVITKSPLGCDSIRYYRITTDKDVRQLSLGQDTCITLSNNIRLQATEGYMDYFWNDNTMAAKANFTISHPGKYWVRVSNTCGSYSDTITIFDQCDYPVFMPRAFTPNYDHLNDYYRVPLLNKNKLIIFKIYNRWGKLVFQTTNPMEGWDGSLHNEPLPPDTFSYYLEMEGLSGKRIFTKGSFLLVR